MPTKVLIGAGSSPELYGIKQDDAELVVYSGCCGSGVTPRSEAVTCDGCGTEYPPKKVTREYKLDPDGFWLLADVYDLKKDRSKLEWWIESWTGLKVKVSVSD